MLNLELTAKKTPGSRDRCVPLEHTAERILALRGRFAITRVGDTTLLDRTGIPTFCAMVPNSPDVLGVYNGKGRTPLAARVSALMEAFERQAAAYVDLPVSPHSLDEVERSLPIGQLELLPEARGEAVDCVEGTDLVTGERMLVPLALVRFPWRGRKLFARTSTNGLASGNTLSEAIYHALTEMIERHVWSLFHVRAVLVPRFYGDAGATDASIARIVGFPTGDAYLDELFEDIKRSGLVPRVMLLNEGSLPPVAVASVVEPGSEPPMAHMGQGCSLSPAHAIERALTEAIQSRVVDVQGAREDLLRSDDPKPTVNPHARRPRVLPKDCWFVDLPAHDVRLHDLRDDASDDVVLDVKTLLERLPENGIRRAVAIDISPPDQPLAVVRIVGPDFETTAIDGRIGPLAEEEFNPLRHLHFS